MHVSKSLTTIDKLEINDTTTGSSSEGGIKRSGELDDFFGDEGIDSDRSVNKATETDQSGRKPPKKSKEQAKNTLKKKVPTRPRLDILADEDFDDELDDVKFTSSKNSKR